MGRGTLEKREQLQAVRAPSIGADLDEDDAGAKRVREGVERVIEFLQGAGQKIAALPGRPADDPLVAAYASVASGLKVELVGLLRDSAEAAPGEAWDEAFRHLDALTSGNESSLAETMDEVRRIKLGKRRDWPGKQERIDQLEKIRAAREWTARLLSDLHVDEKIKLLERKAASSRVGRLRGEDAADG